MLKRCPKCEEQKSFICFSKDKYTPDGLYGLCKTCVNKATKIFKEKVKKRKKVIPEFKICSICKIEKSSKEFYKNNSQSSGIHSSCKECEIKDNKIYYESLHGRFVRYGRKAKEADRQFLLSIEEFNNITKQPCHFCGGFYKNQTNGIDRMNNNLGYVLSNCVPCCFICNWMKSDFTKDEFIEHVLKLLKHCILNFR